MREVNTDRSFNQENLSPFRGPSGYQSRSQYYDVLNRFLTFGVRVRRYARFKRIGDKQGWGAPEWKEGLELDRSRFLNEWKLSQAGAVGKPRPSTTSTTTDLPLFDMVRR